MDTIRARTLWAPVLIILCSVSVTPRPAAAALADPAIAAAGDIACERPDRRVWNDDALSAACRMKATSDLLVGRTLAAVLPLGDNQYERGSLGNYRDSYGATWGRLNAIAHPVPGNHEYLTPDASAYFAYFGRAAGDPGKGYYSFDIGTWHLVALNSNCAQVGGCGRDSPQERWLRGDLAAHPAACTLAYWHHPRFSSGWHGSNRAYTAFWEDLYAAGADVVLSAHDHDYERFNPQDPSGGADAVRGIRQFVVGTGGRNRYIFRRIALNSAVRNADTFGVLLLTLHPDGYDWRFLPERGARFVDSGSARCH